MMSDPRAWPLVLRAPTGPHSTAEIRISDGVVTAERCRRIMRFLDLCEIAMFGGDHAADDLDPEPV
jgi:hypothetical protein